MVTMTRQQSGLLQGGYAYEIATPEPYIGRTYYEMTVQLPEDVPNIFVDCLLNELRPDKILHEFSKSQQLRLEGGFDRFYATYVSDARRLEFLTLMTPNIMYEIMKLGLTCDIELVNKRLMLYWPVPKGKHDPSQEMVEAATILTQKLDRILRRFDDLHEATPVDETIDAARKAGTRLENPSRQLNPVQTPAKIADFVVFGTPLALFSLAVALFGVEDASNEQDALASMAGWLFFWSFVFAILIPFYILGRRIIDRKHRRSLAEEYEKARQQLE